MYGPVVAFAVFAATCLNEAFVQRQVVSNAVSPALVLVSVVGKVI